MVVKSLTSKLLVAVMVLQASLLMAVDVSIDRNAVRVNETFELTINMESTPVNQPELTGMPGDLEVLRSSNFYRKSTVNGQSQVQAGWTFTIKALNEGLYTIPSFNIDGQKTQPLTIKVLAAVSSAEINGQADAIKIVSEINTDTVYVQQQLLYTIRLYRSVRAQYASLTEPELEGALIERLGEDIQFETVIDSVRYRVLERNYAIFPQQSGNFTISGVTYNAEVSSGRQSFGTLGSLRGRSRSVSLSSEDKMIEVKPIPATVTDWWLPASDVRIEQSWKPDSSVLQVGDPVTWTYTISAEGLTSTQLPDVLPKEVNGLKFYPENAKSNNLIVDGKLIGKRTQTVAVIASEAGEITLPPVEIAWWNVATDSAQVVTLPEKRIRIDGVESNTVPTQPTISEPATKPDLVTQTDPLEDTPQASESTSTLLYWQAATVFFILLWLITLVWRNNQRTDIATGSAAKAQTSKQAKSNDKHARKELTNALSSNDASRVTIALVNYARTLDSEIHSLADIRKRITDQTIEQELRTLEQARYSQRSSWESKQLAAIVDGLIKGLKQANSHSEEQTGRLKPLHATDL